MTALADAIKKIATGPHLSKDLSQEETYAATMEILSGAADPVQAAIFFIALRMKRETNDENLGVLNALQAVTEQQQTEVSDVLVFADPFNGFNRHCPVSAFLPAVLAAAGLPAVSQGVYEMGPKFGVTHAQVLKLAGYDNTMKVASATQAVNDPEIGWAYLDQSQASPKVYALQELRTRMIKRPCIATLEKMLMPIKGKARTHLLIGFVHKEYPPILGWLAANFGYHSAFIVRGLEGGIVPTLREASRNYRLYDGEMQECVLTPADFGIEQDTRGVIVSEAVSAEKTLEAGMQALNGQHGPAYDSLVYAAAMALWHTGLQPSQQQAADHVRSVINSGKAKAHFEAAIAS